MKTPTEINTMIAEICGWKRGLTNELSFADANKTIHNKCWLNPLGIVSKLPDYNNSLDAMHSAWMILDIHQRRKFSVLLEEAVRYPAMSATQEDVDCLVENATSQQRAIAFLRTMGKDVG